MPSAARLSASSAEPSPLFAQPGSGWDVLAWSTVSPLAMSGVCLLRSNALQPGLSGTGAFGVAINRSAAECEADSFILLMKLAVMTLFRRR
jgi:hypothetical protein